MRRIFFLLFAGGAVLLPVQAACAHCEIPCGIYDDRMRVEMIREDILTLERSMKQIQELSVQADKNYNQLVRWIVNKEAHADKIQEVIYQYFMSQRIKSADEKEGAAYEKYAKELALLHKMLVYAMKAKQEVDLNIIAVLRDLVDAFEMSYFQTTEAMDMRSHPHAPPEIPAQK